MKLPAPKTPREVLLLLSEYEERDGIEGVFDRVDWSASTLDST